MGVCRDFEKNWPKNIFLYKEKNGGKDLTENIPNFLKISIPLLQKLSHMFSKCPTSFWNCPNYISKISARNVQSVEMNTIAAENVSVFLKISVPVLLKLSHIFLKCPTSFWNCPNHISKISARNVQSTVSRRWILQTSQRCIFFKISTGENAREGFQVRE